MPPLQAERLTPHAFSIDVGGTFTDCIGRRPDGSLVRHKLLSSGVTKGAVGEGSTDRQICDPARRGDPPGFWNGFEFRLLDRSGRVEASATVTGFEPSSDQNALAAPRIELATPLGTTPAVGQAYELVSTCPAPLLGVRYLLGLAADEPIPPVAVRLGTTRGTNALLTRTGARTALVTTRGFGDLPWIGYQNRPKLFELAIHKPPPLPAAVVEIDERMSAAGEVLRAPDAAEIERQLAALRSEGIESLAICLLHGFEHPVHERIIEAIARRCGFAEISVSYRVAPLVKIVSRGDTTLLDAYLNPVLRNYISLLRRELAGGDLRILTSAGGLVAADHFVGKDSILSGPAGGVVGFARLAEAAGFNRAIGFDMGGTSTDVSRFDGSWELEYETEKAGVRVVAPMLAIETVAAGGGSICGFDGVKLVVGPASAGADPGPACYGRGGPLTVTDLNVFLGRIRPEFFPFPLDHGAVQRRLTELAAAVAEGTGRRFELAELADGLLRVANAHVVRALRKVSIARGYDPRQYILVPFGGAAGQHACALARGLGIRQLLCHPDAGLLSVRGIGLAEPVRHRVAGVYRPYDAGQVAALETVFERLSAEAIAELAAEIAPLDAHAGREDWRDRMKIERRLDLRYRGVEACLTIARPPDGDYAAAFRAAHERLYGYAYSDRPLEIVAARVEVRAAATEPLPRSAPAAVRAIEAKEFATAWFADGPAAAQIFRREELAPGDRFVGPAIVHEFASTTVVEPGWQADVLSQGELLLSDVQPADEPSGVEQASSLFCRETGQKDPSPLRTGWKPVLRSDSPDPVLLEIFNNHFAAIAEQMGIVLRNTALSVNVKERLDFSCAIFTASGELVVNAPHIPVHLGSMGQTVRQILADNPALRPGDALATNDPYRGGTHLPDVTVTTPVFDGAGQLIFFTASRAHHAEIGGVAPGSMPHRSRNLAEEGVLIRNFKLLDAAGPRWDEMRRLLLSGPYPSRAVEDDLADLAAQVAANRQGAGQLLALIDEQGWPLVQSYMGHIRSAAERKTRQALARLPPGRREFVDHLDDGSPIRVALTTMPSSEDDTQGPALEVDFTGSAAVSPYNFNANRAIVSAAIMYVLRLLIDEEIPLNEGVLAPVRLVLPEGLLNPRARDWPEDCEAVAAGNVETSQRIVDALLGALGLAAASQGTMNNLLFGDATFGYYETICGGSGATADADGADAVHTHMTNTRITDPEILERRYPVRLHQFAIRRGSGGAGRRRGGDGVTRRIEFLRPLEVSILSQQQGPYPPYGLAGGQPGALGRNTLRRANGMVIELEGCAQFAAAAGDVLTIETPSGGGFAEGVEE